MTTLRSKFTELREIITLSDHLEICKRELYENIENCEDDFEVGNFRFVKESEANDILIDIYKCDSYILGCFNAWFISDNCGIDIEVVEALQGAEAYDALGKLMLSKGIEDLISEYSRVDGYGHAFSSYDGSNDEVYFNDELYIYFRNN